MNSPNPKRHYLQPPIWDKLHISATLPTMAAKPGVNYTFLVRIESEE